MTLTLQSLSDRAEIIGTCTRMAWLADRRDWPALREVFDDDVELDYTSLTGGDPARVTPKQVVDGWAAGLGGLTATQHLVANHLVDVQRRDPQAAQIGDTAVCTAAFRPPTCCPTPSAPAGPPQTWASARSARC